MTDNNNYTAVILFDGVCNFCNSSVHFIIKHDTKKHFRFAAIQSEFGKRSLKKYNINSSKTDSIILIENQKAIIKSTAALRIALRLNKLYPLLYICILVPYFVRNWVYDFIARNRYKWFGKKEVCMIPSQEIRALFIDDKDETPIQKDVSSKF